jgi:hypothetical protein
MARAPPFDDHGSSLDTGPLSQAGAEQDKAMAQVDQLLARMGEPEGS